MQATDANSIPHDLARAERDVAPLAWVVDGLCTSLDGAAKALQRFVGDAEADQGADLASLDASQLHIASQQLQQAAAALALVDLAGPALFVRAMQAAVQKFVLQPVHCTQNAASKMASASFALAEYLQGVRAGQQISAVSLFPQYREVQELGHADRIHPADLWSVQWRWLDPELALAALPRHYDAQARTRFDQSVLQLMKGQAPAAAASLKELSLEFSAAQADRQPRIFWKIAAAFFEALAHDLLPSDIYVRRASSSVLLQYASLSKGDAGVSERLAHDLLFFCAQAAPAAPAQTPVLTSVRAAYGLSSCPPVDDLAKRLDGVKNGGQAQASEPWMEQPQRHVSVEQTMVSAVDEFRAALGELEKSLAIFFPTTTDKTGPASAPSDLPQRRGAASVLGLGRATQAVLLMRDSVERMRQNEIDEELARAAGSFDQLGHNLGALSFLIDMLKYQPALAKKLFVYNEAKGELQPLLGQADKAPNFSLQPARSASALPPVGLSVLQALHAGAPDHTLTVKLDAPAVVATAGLGDLTEAEVNAEFQALSPSKSILAPAPATGAELEPAQPLAADAPANDDDQVKVIGDLRVGIALYNVYLNEADEWSRRLVTEVSEWALERSHAVGDSTVSLAHALALSSATVGFVSLSDMAQALEHALGRSQRRYSSAAAAKYADLFVRAAESIHRLLHQFAAGFLKDADVDLLQQLHGLDFSEPDIEIFKPSV